MIDKITDCVHAIPPGYFLIAFLMLLACFGCFNAQENKQQNRTTTQPMPYHEYYSDQDHRDIRNYAYDQEAAREDCGAPCEYGTPF